MKNLEFIGAIDAGCFDQLIGNGLHVLLHHEDSEAAEHSRDDQCFVAVHPAKCLDHGILRDNGNTPRDHHSRKYESEKNISSFKFVFTQYKTTDSTCINYDQSDHYRNNNTV